MLNSINKLLKFAKGEDKDIYNKLLSLAYKVGQDLSPEKTYLLIDIEEMESMVDPSKVVVKGQIGSGVGRVELDLW